MYNSKKLIFVLILITSLVFLFFTTTSSNSKKSDKFIGTVKSVEASSIIVLGSFEDEKSKFVPSYEYEIKVDSTAKIVKKSFMIPKGGQMFEVAKLPKDTANVDLETLRKDVQNVSQGIDVKLSRNFLGGIQKKASEITYIGPKY